MIGNKIDDQSDVDFLRSHVGDDLLTCISRSTFVKALERGRVNPMSELEPANIAALELIKDTVDGVEKDWHTYTRQAHEFHLRNAHAWASAKVGEDLTAQIDPEYVLGYAETIEKG